MKVAEQLRGSGIKIAIDDFGAGYSSFSSLRELPFIEFKLDGSFVKNCAIDATNAAICQTAIDLAHRFGSAAVAEGIETAGDLHALMVMGCDCHLFSEKGNGSSGGGDIRNTLRIIDIST